MAFIVLTNGNRFITNWCSLYHYKTGKCIINRGSYYKSGQLLQIDAKQFALVFEITGFQVRHYIERECKYWMFCVKVLLRVR